MSFTGMVLLGHKSSGDVVSTPEHDTINLYWRSIMHPQSITKPPLCECGCGHAAKPGNRFLNHHARTRLFCRPMAERFWEKVEKTDTCWLWTGALIPTNGYGKLGEGGEYGRTLLAHRVSYELHCGPIPEGMCVCHNCDVNYPLGDRTYRRCVNPGHLFLGTITDNNADMVRKGRNVVGERAHAKLKEAEIREIRRRGANGEYLCHIAKDYPVAYSNLWLIMHGRTWKHII